jgi:hypothetical protein
MSRIAELPARRTGGTFAVLVTTTVLAWPGSGLAQAPPSKTAQAVAIASAPPEIDGRLDDEAWSRAPVIADFVQKIPNEGAQPSVRTEVRLIYDDDALYVGPRLLREDPSAIRTSITRLDAESDD